MDAAAGPRGGEPAPQVLWAMQNLRLAVQLRLSRGRLTEGAARAVAAVLDAAATAVDGT